MFAERIHCWTSQQWHPIITLIVGSFQQVPFDMQHLLDTAQLHCRTCADMKWTTAIVAEQAEHDSSATEDDHLVSCVAVQLRPSLSDRVSRRFVCPADANIWKAVIYRMPIRHGEQKTAERVVMWLPGQDRFAESTVNWRIGERQMFLQNAPGCRSLRFKVEDQRVTADLQRFRSN